MPTHDGQIDYIELPATDVAAAKRFYAGVFGWAFEDYGPDYTSFKDGRLSGGFYTAANAKPTPGAPLVVLYHADLELIQTSVARAGGRITRETFSFPGGRRFHFADPVGNELAVWSDR